MSLFAKNNAAPLNKRQRLIQNYKTASYNLFLLIIFSAINIVLLLTNADSYFLFSASIPYYITMMGMLLCGKFPPEYYGDMTDMVFLDNAVFVVAVVISVVILGVYLLCAILAHKRKIGGLIAALVLFACDTVAMFLIYDFGADTIIDLLFHVWVLAYLIMGVSSHLQLKKLPPDPIPEAVEQGSEASNDSPAIGFSENNDSPSDNAE